MGIQSKRKYSTEETTSLTITMKQLSVFLFLATATVCSASTLRLKRDVGTEEVQAVNNGNKDFATLLPVDLKDLDFPGNLPVDLPNFDSPVDLPEIDLGPLPQEKDVEEDDD